MDRAFHCRFHGNFRKEKVEKGLEVPFAIIYTYAICKCSETLLKTLDSSDSSSIYCSRVPPFCFTPTKTYLLELPEKVEVDGR